MKTWLSRMWLLVLAATIVIAVYAIRGSRELLAEFPAMLAAPGLADWALVALATLACFALDFLRLATLLAIGGHRLGLRAGLQAIAVSEFASIVTPTAELQVPATVYALVERGIPSATATAASVTKTLYMIMWVSLLGLVVLVGPGAALPAGVADHVAYCAIPLALIVAFFASIVIFARPIRAYLDRRPRRVYAWLSRAMAELATIGRSTRPMHLLVHLCTIGYILAYGLLGYILCDAFGLAITIDRARQVFTLSLVVQYLGLAPGSILVSEVATAYLLDPQFAEAQHPALLVAIALRFLTRYVMFLPGAALFVAMVRGRRVSAA